ncbi:MAG: hypothetical protein GXP62_14500 [Oligoflexia bacterium]|nr:hypothetical protein [Oligoflexia bacterium]
MFHLVAHARPASKLFSDWEEAAALWARLGRVPAIRSMVLMPSHVHLISSMGDPRALDDALRAYALWRNHHRGQRGSVWAPRPPPELLPDPKHIRRTHRYVHLNPCRARLVPCPLAWPFSTHRDALGLTLNPIRPRESNVVAFHDYVSSDPSCKVGGTPYPGDRILTDHLPLQALAGAVSEFARVPLAWVHRSGSVRSLWIGAAKSLTLWSGAHIAREIGVSPATVSSTPKAAHPVATKLARLVADDRFP